MEGYNADQKTQDFLSYTKYQVKQFYSDATIKVKMKKETVLKVKENNNCLNLSSRLINTQKNY